MDTNLQPKFRLALALSKFADEDEQDAIFAKQNVTEETREMWKDFTHAEKLLWIAQHVNNNASLDNLD